MINANDMELWTKLVKAVLGLAGPDACCGADLTQGVELATSDGLSMVELPLGAVGKPSMHALLCFDEHGQLFRIVLKGRDRHQAFASLKNLLDRSLPRLRTRRMGFETACRYGTPALRAELLGMPFGFGLARSYALTLTLRRRAAHPRQLSAIEDDGDGDGVPCPYRASLSPRLSQAMESVAA